MSKMETVLDNLEFSQEVREAMVSGKPVLVLESTIITHGMPYPENYETAKMLGELCREKGVTPAIIAIYKGKIRVGLEDETLHELSQMTPDVEKVSIRDIGYCLALKKSGGTTVAATSYLARICKLEVFATGGIGGVHRGVSDSWDISADLESLKNNPVIIISAGVKAILDIPKTLEVLESYSVPVFGYKTDDFPAFYSSKSGNKVRKINNTSEIAQIWNKQEKLAISSGMLIANPIPKKYEIPAEVIEHKIQIALEDARENGITGKDITPFLLQRLYELTGGVSLATNIELIKNNVKLGCQIAKEINKLWL